MAASGRESGDDSTVECRMRSDKGEELRLRVTLASSWGARSHMEDYGLFSWFEDEDNPTSTLLTYAGVFDGHGGKSAAEYVQNHLLRFISNDPRFSSEDDEDVMEAIRAGYKNIQKDMMQQLVFWPKTASGTPSTAGTTASIAIIRNGKLFIGHVGDSRIVLGVSNKELPDDPWTAINLTVDHTPNNAKEKARIESYGGKVVEHNNVSRVVWSKRVRVGPGEKGLIITETPFLSVARSLGDFWSYDPRHKVYLVSPEPDVSVMRLDPAIHRCLILGSDGLWGVVGSEEAVNFVRFTLEARRDEPHPVSNVSAPKSPSENLVDLALHFWRGRKKKADNVSVITILFDQPPTDQHPTESSSESDGDLTEEIIMEEDTPSFLPDPYLRPRTRSSSRSGCLDATPSTSNSAGARAKAATKTTRQIKSARGRTEEIARRLLCSSSSNIGSSTPSAAVTENPSAWNAGRGKRQVAPMTCKSKKPAAKPKSARNADKKDIQPDVGLAAKMIKIAKAVVHEKPTKVKATSVGTVKRARFRALSPDITCLPP